MSSANASSTVYCANHPTREANLHCNRCGKPICVSCAVHTPTGYRCKDCVRNQQKVFVTAVTTDYIVAFLVAAVLSTIGGAIAIRLGWFLIFIAPAAGGIIAEVVRWAVKRRRAKRLFQLAALGVVAGALPQLLGPLILLLGGYGLQALYALLWPLAYVVLAAPTTYARLSGINIG